MPPFSDVPALMVLINLPQDELTESVSRFRAGVPPTGRQGGAGQLGGAGDLSNVSGDPAAAAQGMSPEQLEARDRKYYLDWLTALKTLDFDRLTRNAQVDYLYIKKASELALDRVGKPLPATNPRKTDNSGI